MSGYKHCNWTVYSNSVNKGLLYNSLELILQSTLYIWEWARACNINI